MNKQRRLRTFIVATQNPQRAPWYGKGVDVRVRAYTVAEAKEKVRTASHGQAQIFGVREP